MTENTEDISEKKKRKASTRKKDSEGDESYPDTPGRMKRISGLLLLFSAVILLISFLSFCFTAEADASILHGGIAYSVSSAFQLKNALGPIGGLLAYSFINWGVGLAAFLIIPFLVTAGINLLFDRKYFPLARIAWFSFLSIFWLSPVLAFVESLTNNSGGIYWGGAYGNYLCSGSGLLPQLLKPIGTGLLLGVVTLAALVWFFNLNFNFLLNLFKKSKETELSADADIDAEPITQVVSTGDSIFEKDRIDVEPEAVVNSFKEDLPEEEENEESEEETISDEEIGNEIQLKVRESGTKTPAPEEEPKLELTIEETVEEKEVDASEIEHKTLDTPYDPTLDLHNYEFPRIDYLDEHGNEKIKIDAEELERNKNQIIQTLNNYKIEISKIKATIGPTVTLYEIVPAAGVRISKIKSLEDDIALSLSALGIRIIAPIPGKGTIGIEVPNEKKEIVSMRNMIASEKFQKSNMDLPICLGKTISNEITIVDLAKMPHLLIAGATGQGKSVGINSLLVSLLYSKHPSQMKFVMVDPKKVELSIYSVIEKHYLAKLPGEEEPIITDTKKVINTLNSLCLEMDDRYDLLKKAVCRNIKEYNAKFIARGLNPQNGHRYLPYIVVVIDEFADLILTAGKEVEMPIARLAQLARAIGIHLVLATQRPSVNIITGTIKANFPSRISFKVASKIDSRTILDSGGAEQLIGRGDMLLSQGNDLMRIQCGFVDTPEIDRIVNHIQKQPSYPSAYELPEFISDEEAAASGGFDASEKDPMFDEAARLIVANQVGSTSLIQRRFKLGYNRAGRLMDQLEAAGVVGPNLGSKAREVLIKTEIDLERHLNQL